MKNCLGCGVELQETNIHQKGYTPHLEKEYCFRCFRLKNYNDLVDQEINSKLFLEKVQQVTLTQGAKIFYYVVDLFDLNGSRNKDLETLLRQQRVVVIANKFDLLPKSVKANKILNKVKEVFKNSCLEQFEVVLGSAFSQTLIKQLVKKVVGDCENNYFVGYSNVGKSSLINSLLHETNQASHILESSYFNTTLDFISVALTNKVKIFDTPGVMRNNSLVLMSSQKQNKHYYFHQELKQTTFQLDSDQSLVLGGMVIVNFNFAEKQKLNVHYYGFNRLKIHRTKTSKARNFLQQHQKELLPSPKEIQEAWSVVGFGFKEEKSRVDVVISGLGWISLEKTNSLKISLETNARIKVEKFKELVYIRQPLI